jgi:serine/threonine protein kinase
MTPERWRRIHGLFEQVCQCPAGERQRHLDRLRVENATLADEVANLLCHDARASDEGFLSATCPDSVKAHSSAGAERLIGRRIGPYEVQQHIAGGGMGDVYRAARVDDYRQTIALKVIRNGLANEELRARFQTERQVLAALSHPNVVRMLDGGTTEDGLLYFVMEYIDGQPLDRWCERRQPAMRERLVLLRAVARAVDYAHQQGVIHRDLKPGNVLVEADGTPKISDFGLAKRLDATGPSDGASQTRTGVILGSPSYLAPEQAGGSPQQMGPATDVYALGAILYELLTGRPPFKGVTLLDTLEQVRSAEPLSPRRCSPKLARDLETICLKALAKDPAGRFPTAAAFAADLERFLLGLPIEARPVSRPVKAARWCRRRPVVAALLAALVLAVTAGFAGVTWQWRRAEANFANEEEQRRQAEANLAEVERQARRAEENLQKAKLAVRDLFALSSHDGIAGKPDLDPLQVLILEETQKYYREFLRQDDDPSLRAALASCYLRLAHLYSHNPKQHCLVPAAYQSALSLEQELIEKHPDSRQYQLLYASGNLDLASFQRERGEATEAGRSLQQAIALLDAYMATGPGNPDFSFALACHCHELGLLLHERGETAKALEWHQKASVLTEKLVRSSPGEARYRIVLARSLFHIARCQNEKGRRDEARHAFEESATLWRRLAEEQPLQTSFQRDLAACCHSIGNIHRDAGVDTLAVSFYRQALQIRKKLVRDNPDYLPFLRDASGTEYRLGESLERLDRTEEALTAYQHALARERELVSKAPEERADPQRLRERNEAVARLSLRHEQLTEPTHGR